MTSSNAGRIIVSDEEKKIVNQLIFMNFVQFIVFLLLKVLSPEGYDHKTYVDAEL